MDSIRSIGILGYGAFGALAETLIQRFLPETQIRVHSIDRTPDGTRFFSLEEACASDIVLFSVPIREFETTVKDALPHIPKESVLVDISTVKIHTADVLKRIAGERLYVSCHPLFGPESYAKTNSDVAGFRIVMSEHSLPPETYAAVCAFLKKCGFEIMDLSAEEHDKHMAETLFLTHFIGQVVTHAGFTRGRVDTVSFQFLMQAVESVKNDTALFKEVFRFNPYCVSILNRFETAEHEVRVLLEE